MRAGELTLTKSSPLLMSMLGAGAVTTLAAIPPFLLSAQSVLMREDLGFNEQQLGLAVSGFFATAALTSLTVGGLLDRTGPRVAVIVCAGLAALSAFGIALVSPIVQHGYAVLLGCLLVAGVANAGLQLTANLSVATTLPVKQQGLGYGIKQSAIPFSILLGGLAVPLIAVTVGWRWTYLGVAVAALSVLAVGLRRRPASVAPRRASVGGLAAPPRGALLLTFAAMGLASMAVNSLGAFLPVWAFTSGMSPSAAGLLFSIASAASIISRIAGGAAADRRGRRHMPVVARDLVVGAVGVLLISTGQGPLLAAGALLAFAFGWGWPGLLMFAVVRMGRERPARASTYVQAGAFLGGATGPALFGILVTATDFRTAWSAVAALMVGAAGVLLLARALFVNDLKQRPFVDS